MIDKHTIDRANFDLWTPPQGNPEELYNTHPSYNDHILREDFRRTGIGSISVGTIPDSEKFSALESGVPQLFGIEALLIKEAGSNDYKIPRQLKPYLEGFITSAATDQHRRCPLAELKHAVLFFRRSYVAHGTGQVAPFWHCDDVEAAVAGNALSAHPFSPAHNMTIHGYVMSNFAGTLLQTAEVRDADLVFSGQGDVQQQLAASRQAEPHEIALFNSYTRHTSSALSEAWVNAVGRKDPQICHLFNQSGGLRSFAGLMYIPTSAMEPLLGKYQRVKEVSALNWDF